MIVGYFKDYAGDIRMAEVDSDMYEFYMKDEGWTFIATRKI